MGLTVSNALLLASALLLAAAPAQAGTDPEATCFPVAIENGIPRIVWECLPEPARGIVGTLCAATRLC